MFVDAIAEEDGGVEGSRAVARRADDLVRRCYSGLRGPAFQVEVVRAIHALLPVDAVFLATADPGTLLLTGIFAEEPLAGVADQFLDNEFGQVDVNKFQSLATGPRHVATLDSATHGGRAGSARYRDIMAPLGLGDELRAALVTPSGCWGYLCLHRAESPYGFTPAEVRMVGRLAASLGNGCRLSLAAPGTEGIAAIAPGVVVLHPDHTLAAITGEAERLLADIADHSSRAGRLPAAVYAAAACLQSIDRGTASPDASPTVRVRTTNGGWLLVHATHLHGTVDDDIAVIIEAAHPSRTCAADSQLARTDTAGGRGSPAGAARGIHQHDWRRTAPVRVHGERSSKVDLRQGWGTKPA
jgi:hypothetical protein